ncbi:MAG: geranylgeranyl diphosphate synthase, type [Streptosporangiaceae bacterium]|nr:geranylgeranyl diphosphate synthase, type [Streptosporangiaceae bacterium]
MTVQVGEVPAAPTDVTWPGQLIEAELAAMLGRRMAELDFLGADIAPFDDVLGRLVRGPGKRLRPAFVYWGYRAAGGAPAGPDAGAALRVGCAVEFLHACALICDDLMDDSAVRRWEPAAHVRLAGPDGRHGWPGPRPEFGRAAALVLGLQAFTWADAALSDAGLRPDRLAPVLRLFTTLRTEVIGGQYLDLVYAQRGSVPAGSVPAGEAVSVAEQIRAAERVIRYKSAKYTVERPLQLGAAVAGAGGEGFLSGYGLPLGEAFQLRDDVLGVFGDPESTGKPAGEDIREGKQTLLLVLGRQMAGPAERPVIETVPGNPAATGADIAGVREALAGCGALDAVERRIASLAGQARATLEAAPGVPGDARAALLHLAGLAARWDR